MFLTYLGMILTEPAALSKLVKKQETKKEMN